MGFIKFENLVDKIVEMQPDLHKWSDGDYWKQAPEKEEHYDRMLRSILCAGDNWCNVRALILDIERESKEYLKELEEENKKVLEQVNSFHVNGMRLTHEACYGAKQARELYGKKGDVSGEELWKKYLYMQRALDAYNSEYGKWWNERGCEENIETYHTMKAEQERTIKYANMLVVCGDRIAEEMKTANNEMKVEVTKEKVDLNVEHECFKSKLYNRDAEFFNRLYDLLLGLGLIEKGNKTNFKRLFGGENTKVRWKWQGGTYELYVLMKMLVEYEVIGKNRYFAIAAECFYFEGDVKINVGSCNKGNDDLKESICGFFEKEFQKS